MDPVDDFAEPRDGRRSASASIRYAKRILWLREQWVRINGFVRHNERNFSWRDQERLASAARAAQARGATVIVSNAYHKSVGELFHDA